MAIICFANSGSGIGKRAAAAVAEKLVKDGLSAAFYDCLERVTVGSHMHSAGEVPLRNAVCGRQFIEEARGLKRSHEHVVVDLSGAGDQIAAIAFAMADLILIPFLPHEADADRFVKTIELLDILSSHRSQPLRHAVFLVSRDSIGPRLHLEIAGQLIRRGLTTLPVCYVDAAEQPGQDATVQIAHTDPGDEAREAIGQTDVTRFVQCALTAALHPDKCTTAPALAAGW